MTRSGQVPSFQPQALVLTIAPGQEVEYDPLRHLFHPQPTTSLWRLGCSILGYDAYTGGDVPYPNHPFFGPSFKSSFVSQARRYGFHATLKAPFAPAPGTSESQLADALRDFADRQASFSLAAPKIVSLGSFLAFVPSAPSAALDRLAAACVRDFERWRAPMSPSERDRREAAGLSPRQIALMDRWGYPYVMDEFRFHLTLSSALEASTLVQFRQAVEQLFAPIRAPLNIDGLALFRQASANESFRVIARFAFQTRPLKAR